MRTIDADALIEKCGDWYVEEGTESGFIGTLKNLLATEPTIQPVVTDTNVGSCSEIPNSSDAINRQDAIDALDKRFDNIPMEQTVEILKLRKDLRELPTIQPEPHEGHWIKHIDPSDGEQYECSECGVLWEFNDGTTPEDNEAYFCPKCGKKLITK